jgi:hypothetical protein
MARNYSAACSAISHVGSSIENWVARDCLHRIYAAAEGLKNAENKKP